MDILNLSKSANSLLILRNNLCSRYLYDSIIPKIRFRQLIQLKSFASRFESSQGEWAAFLVIGTLLLSFTVLNFGVYFTSSLAGHEPEFLAPTLNNSPMWTAKSSWQSSPMPF
jgi:hypothetical protein